jgi:hypothetical protein
LDLSSNKLNGGIPSSLGQLTSSTSMFLHSNNLKGLIPAAICSLRVQGNPNDNYYYLMTLTADCGGSPPEVKCTCCTSCHKDS